MCLEPTSHPNNNEAGNCSRVWQTRICRFQGTPASNHSRMLMPLIPESLTSPNLTTCCNCPSVLSAPNSFQVHLTKFLSEPNSLSELSKFIVYNGETPRPPSLTGLHSTSQETIPNFCISPSPSLSKKTSSSAHPAAFLMPGGN